jgi:hypothetical protein
MFSGKKREAERAANDFKSWAMERAVRIDLSAPASANVGKLDALDHLVSGKRIAFVGEPDHFIHEKYAYRQLILEYLARRGFNAVGEELSRTDGARIAGFIASGDQSQLDRVATYGYRGGLRDDRNDIPKGVLKDAYSDKYPVAEFRAEQVKFAHALRQLGVRFFGFDVDVNPGCAYQDLTATLAGARDDAIVEDLLHGLARVSGESLDEEISRLDAALALNVSKREYLGKILGADIADETEYLIQWLRDSFAYLRAIIPLTRWEDLNPAMAARELMMHREVMRQLETAAHNERLALLSHDVHLCRDMNAIAGMIASVGPGGTSAPPLGEFLSCRFPNQVFSIWMLIGQGRDRQQMAPLKSEIRLILGSLNAMLAEVGQCFVLPIDRGEPRARALNSQLLIAMDGNASIETAIAAQCDAIFFIRDVTPIRV